MNRLDEVDLCAISWKVDSWSKEIALQVWTSVTSMDVVAAVALDCRLSGPSLRQGLGATFRHDSGYWTNQSASVRPNLIWP